MSQRLELLKQIAHGLAVQFGSSCEIVIHDLKKLELESSIVYIENGHVSNRKLGDGPSSVVFETLNSDASKVQDRLSYLTKTEDGRILKSSTMFIREEDNHISYIFSLNYDITALLTVESAISSLIRTEPKKEEGQNTQPQTITHNVNELLDTLIEQALSLVGKPVALMNKDDKVTVVQYLNNAGAFLITKSGDKVASLLGISKFTLYSYMDAGKES
ncbi:helix-turn-helix transcriptional regulator [Luxibacter massiliensis]|uniref:helix-turn-helix transcriptional regulator n=1 Tax=Luxibacter massiliensis TaxID=2219695 RepID=UPI000F05F65F|nr:helix-turn-helix transcriptional regulator [Luxibacter massiliensis]